MTATPSKDSSPDWLESLLGLPPVHWVLPEPPPLVPPAPHDTCGVEPLAPITDPDAVAFEKDSAPDDGKLEPALAHALHKLERLVKAAGAVLELRSGYRPEAYQAHLQQVWTKWMMELRNNREPGCQLLRAEVHGEFSRHNLIESQKPATSSDHSRGLAFDARVVVPPGKHAKPVHVNVDHLAMLAGVHRPDIRHDPVHFKLVTRSRPAPRTTVARASYRHAGTP